MQALYQLSYSPLLFPPGSPGDIDNITGPRADHQILSDRRTLWAISTDAPVWAAESRRATAQAVTNE